MRKDEFPLIDKHVQNEIMSVLQSILAEIEDAINAQRCFDTENSVAQYVALNWCRQVVERHIVECSGHGKESDEVLEHFSKLMEYYSVKGVSEI